MELIKFIEIKDYYSEQNKITQYYFFPLEELKSFKFDMELNFLKLRFSDNSFAGEARNFCIYHFRNFLENIGKEQIVFRIDFTQKSKAFEKFSP
jgi:hypothetical protein